MSTGYAGILTVEQAAERLQVSSKTVYVWLRAGRIPGRKIGKVWRMSEEAIVDFLRGELGKGAASAAEVVSKNGRKEVKTTR
jgi:excisionase family DNA binding protein